MSLTCKTTDQLEQIITEAREKEKAANATLTPNGRNINTPDELARRVQEIEAERKQTIRDVEAEVNRRLAEIDEQLLTTETDPVVALKGDDLNRASGLAPSSAKTSKRRTSPPSCERSSSLAIRHSWRCGCII